MMFRTLTKPTLALNRAIICRQTTRTMASSFPGKKEFLCIIPDKPDALQRRLKVRPLHFESIKPVVAAGHMVAGGAMVDYHTPPGETMAFKGSMGIYHVENIEEVWKLIKADPYAVNDVWDLDKVQIIPYVSAVREKL